MARVLLKTPTLLTPTYLDNYVASGPDVSDHFLAQGVDFSDSFDLLRGRLDVQADLASLTNKQVGEIGEEVAFDFLTKNGFTEAFQLKNASDNGIDYIGLAPDGRIEFFEVKATGIGRVPTTSALQENSQTYIIDLLCEARSGLIRGQSISDEMKIAATDYYNNIINGVGDPIPANIIGVDLLSETIRISPW